jgi:hypothetical protein
MFFVCDRQKYMVFYLNLIADFFLFLDLQKTSDLMIYHCSSATDPGKNLKTN